MQQQQTSALERKQTSLLERNYAPPVLYLVLLPADETDKGGAFKKTMAAQGCR